MPRTEPYGTRSTVRSKTATLDNESNSATQQHDPITCSGVANQSGTNTPQSSGGREPRAPDDNQSETGKPAASPPLSPD